MGEGPEKKIGRKLTEREGKPAKEESYLMMAGKHQAHAARENQRADHG